MLVYKNKIMKEIKETGYWDGETAHIHHVHSEELSEWICKFLKKNVSLSTPIRDYGSGLGNYLKDLQNFGFKELVGFEADPPKQRVFPHIIKQDLTIPMTLNSKGVSISLEVGEHIPEQYMNVYLDNICNNCNNYLITSWAVRGQDGFGHVNCLNNDEIIPLIEQRGFEYLKEDSLNARSVITEKTWWFKNTILIFKKTNEHHL